VYLELAAAAAIAALVSVIACGVVIKTGPVDEPNAPRKAHGAPTPTSGGLGMAAGFGASIILFALFSETMWAEFPPRAVLFMTVAFAVSYVFLAVGYWDDARDLSAKLKFALFGSASLAATLGLGPVLAFPLIDDVELVLPFWAGCIGTALWIFTVVNAVNFMDGANGLALGSVAIGLAALAAIGVTHGSMTGAVLCLCAVGAIAGFLYWNFPAGRLFAGDSGALFAGALAALSSIIVVHDSGISPVIPPILFFPLLADVLVTLAWRAWRRRSLFDGHSEHLYQIARHGGMSHAEVAFIYWSATGACGAIGYLLANEEGVASLIALATMAGASIVVSTAVRRFAGRRGIEGV
jgi:UDP-N-acetylmuramyl pentapeptide phosphotransferase/UDP-N-acetylglucosamine-1-phosphate transferase